MFLLKLLSIGIGIGNWYTCSVDNIKTTKYFNILVSLNFPYLRKITDVLYYGVNIDFFEDLFNNANKNNSRIFLIMQIKITLSISLKKL